jgi:bleomycin hydrolase
MKRLSLLFSVIFVFSFNSFSQDKTDKLIFKQYEPGFYQNVILKDVRAVDNAQQPHKLRKYPRMDQSGLDLPNKLSFYKKNTVWHNPVISQGNAGTCWCYSTTSFLESDIYRMTKKKVKLSETYTVYWEYVEKAREFVRTRGTSNFSEGSEANAVTRIMKKYGAMPRSVYTGLKDGRKYPSHAKMFEEMNDFLQSVKKNNMWNEDFVVETIKAIENKYIGQPPAKFSVDGKEYTPMSYMTDYLQLNPDDYVDIISLKEGEYWTQIEYKVPDNWWHSADYYNVPLDVFMQIIEDAIKNGYSMSIGGDVSEPGFSRETQCALIPSFDIPQEYINEDARQMRFSNGSTTDDHGMHLVGFTEYKGHKWFLIKDSSSGSRNNDPNAPEFGYYFFRDDYVKLKMMDFMIHKDAVKDVLKKFKK